MIATFLQLHHRRAVMASLPPFTSRDFDESVRFLVLGTVASAVPPSITYTAHLGLAAAAFTVFTARRVGAYIRRLDPVSAPFRRAVDAVLGGVLLVFTVPLHLKFNAEQLVDVLQRDMVCAATSRRHVLRIVHRQLENALEAVMAHNMAAT